MSISEKYYLTIDEMPLSEWIKCHEGKIFHCRKFKHKGTNVEDAQAWELVYKDFIEKIGLNDEFKEYLDLLEQRAEYQLEYLRSKKEGKSAFEHGERNRFLLNNIKEITMRINQFHQTGDTKNNMTMGRVLNKLSKMQGYHLKPQEITVLTYFELIKDYSTWQSK